MKAGTEQKMLVGGKLTDTTAIRLKVEQDIAFLTDRICSLEKQLNPNKIVLDTYKGMLASRVSVLKWLMHGGDTDDITANYSTQRSA